MRATGVLITLLFIFTACGDSDRPEKLQKLMSNPEAFKKEFKDKDLTLVDWRNRNLLDMSMDDGSPETTAFLVRKGMDPLAKNTGSNSSAYTSAIVRKNGYPHVMAMLNAKPALKSNKKLMAESLARAARAGKPALVKYFLKLGAPVSTVRRGSDDSEPFGLLHLALRDSGDKHRKAADQAKLLQYLIDAGADVNSTRSPKKRTPLFYMDVDTDTDARKIPDMLVRAGARLGARDADGMPLMAWYSLQERYGMISYLLRKGVRPPAILLVPRTSSKTTSKTVKKRVYNPNSALPRTYRTENQTVYKTEYFKENIPICDSVFRNTYPKLCAALKKAGYKVPRL